MKRATRWTLSLLTKVIVILLVIVLLPFARQLFTTLFPDLKGEIRTQSVILEQKLRSSQRLEVMTVEEEGVLNSETNVIILGTVGRTSIKYRYTASLGINLQNVVMKAETDRIVFLLPDTEILNDSIEALLVSRQNFFSHAIDPKTETLLSEQKEKCRQQYMSTESTSAKVWENTVQAFEKTICSWLEEYSDRHYTFAFERKSDTEKEE